MYFSRDYSYAHFEAGGFSFKFDIYENYYIGTISSSLAQSGNIFLKFKDILADNKLRSLEELDTFTRVIYKKSKKGKEFIFIEDKEINYENGIIKG
jgi:hypothetical protein